MIRTIVIDGIVSALLLVVIAWLLSFLGIPALYMTLTFGIWAIIVVGLVFGLINALLVPLVMRLFRNARGAILFVVTLIVDAAALLLTARFTSAFVIGGMFNGWLTAIVVGAILAAVAPVVLGIFGRGK